MKNTQKCPICSDDLISDITTKEYCALCGMIVKNESRITEKIGNTVKYFCCRLCYSKYTGFH